MLMWQDSLIGFLERVMNLSHLGASRKQAPEGRFGAVPGRFRADFGVQSADFEIGGSSTSS